MRLFLRNQSRKPQPNGLDVLSLDHNSLEILCKRTVVLRESRSYQVRPRRKQDDRVFGGLFPKLAKSTISYTSAIAPQP